MTLGDSGPGPAAASLWAKVLADATGIESSTGTATVRRTPNPLTIPGRYLVDFPLDVRNCAYAAQIAGDAGDPALLPSFISVSVSGLGDGSELFVQIRDESGTVFADAPFHLAVFC